MAARSPPPPLWPHLGTARRSRRSSPSSYVPHTRPYHPAALERLRAPSAALERPRAPLGGPSWHHPTPPAALTTAETPPAPSRGLCAPPNPNVPLTPRHDDDGRRHRRAGIATSPGKHPPPARLAAADATPHITRPCPSTSTPCRRRGIHHPRIPPVAPCRTPLPSGCRPSPSARWFPPAACYSYHTMTATRHTRRPPQPVRG